MNGGLLSSRIREYGPANARDRDSNGPFRNNVFIVPARILRKDTRYDK